MDENQIPITRQLVDSMETLRTFADLVTEQDANVVELIRDEVQHLDRVVTEIVTAITRLEVLARYGADVEAEAQRRLQERGDEDDL